MRKLSDRARPTLLMVGGIMAVVAVLLALLRVDFGVVAHSFLFGLGGGRYQICEIFVKATPLILAGLGCTLGFRCGFINLGAEGQLYMGAMASTAVGLALPGLPSHILVPIMMVSGFLAGGLWALVPGFVKARFGLSEVIMSIMFNYIAINLAALAIRTFLKDPNYNFPMSPPLPVAGTLPLMVARTRLHIGIIFALLTALFFWFFLNKTVKGFEFRSCGCNPQASHCAGINVASNMIISALLSGGLAGLAGMIEIAGVHHKLMDGFSPNYGYTAVMVALLSSNHPFIVVLVAISLAALDAGNLSMQRLAKVPTALSSIILGLIVLAALAHRHLATRTKSKSSPPR